MNNCALCDGCFRNGTPNKIICDGICRQPFHAECANFSQNALMCYREMPNLQWFCDSCIIQTPLSNVSSPLFNKFNSAVVIPASTPSYVQPSIIATKRQRNRKPFPNAKPYNGSVSLVHRFPKFDHNTSNANGSVHEMRPEKSHYEINNAKGSTNGVQPENNFVKSPGRNDKDRSADNEDLKEPSQPKTPPAKSSFAEVLTKSPVAETVSGNSTTQPQNDPIQSTCTTTSSQSDTSKVLYVSQFDPTTTEEQIVYYLLRKNVIKSAEEVSCNMLVSPDVNIDMLSFISFKITASSKVFDSMSKAGLWPEGIIYREFLNR